jgi:hypothetical protein
MNPDQETNKIKKVYSKPRLRMIELVSEEVLGISCKTSYGDTQGVSGGGCLISPCSSIPGS